MARQGRRRGSRQGPGRAGGWLFTCATCAVLLFAAPGLASTTIGTVAGGGSRSDDGAPATSSSLSTPTGVRPVANGFQVAEQGRFRVRRVSIADVASADTGTITTIAGTGRAGSGEAVLDGAATSVSLRLPCCLGVTASGDTLIGDTLGGMVWRVSGGRIRTVAGSGAPSSCSPTPPSEIAAQSAALCFVVGVDGAPGADRFLVAEDGLPDQGRSGGARVYEVDAAGVIHIVAGGGCPSPQPAMGPLGICLASPRGPLYTGNAAAPTEFVVADRGRNVVWRISSTNPATAGVTQIAGTGQATSSDGANLGDGGPASAATLSAPSDLAIEPGRSLLIADRGNCRVRRVASLSPAATVTTIAGTGCDSSAAPGDGGPADRASLGWPQSVAFSPQGILVSESIGGRVRLIQRTAITSAPEPLVTSTVAAFRFDSSQPDPDFRCGIDDSGALDPCSSPALFEGLHDGTHTFSVLDARAPADPSPARHTWVVDTAPPAPLRLEAPVADAVDAPPRPWLGWRPTTDATTGVERYELIVDGITAATLPPAACSDVCRARPESPLSEAAHTWRVRALDGVGLARDSDDRVVHVGSDPQAELTVAPDPVLVGSPVALDASGSRDEGGLIKRFEWDLDGDGVFELDSGRRASISRSFPVAGTVAVSVRTTDAVGRTATASHLLRVSDPPGAPRLYGVSIGGGSLFTRSRTVTLDLSYPQTATGVMLSNDGGFLNAMAFSPSPRMRWKLDSTGPERLPKTVYVRFLSGPFVTDTYTDDIVLDETRPEVLSARARPARARRAAGASVRVRVVRVRARDNLSGIAGIQASVGRRARRSRFRKYAGPRIRVRGSGRVRVRVRDGAGNVSKWLAARSRRAQAVHPYSGPR